MADQLVDDVRQFLRGVEAVQDELATLYQRKRIALTEARASELLSIAESESRLAKQMQGHLARRRQILENSAGQGLPGDSIQNLLKALGGSARTELEPAVNRLRGAAAATRRENWIHWIVAQRAMNHHNELLELIASCGRKSPTYSRSPGQNASGGGAILDASA